MHNIGFFPDCHLLSVTDGSIWIPSLARYSEIFEKPNFQVVKMEFHVHLKNDFQAEMETEGSRLATILGLPPTPRRKTKFALVKSLDSSEFSDLKTL